jgi:hypothetical protein
MYCSQEGIQHLDIISVSSFFCHYWGSHAEKGQSGDNAGVEIGTEHFGNTAYKQGCLLFYAVCAFKKGWGLYMLWGAKRGG